MADLFGLEQQLRHVTAGPKLPALVEVLKAPRTHAAAAGAERTTVHRAREAESVRSTLGTASEQAVGLAGGLDA